MKKTKIACTLTILFSTTIRIMRLCTTTRPSHPWYYKNVSATFGLLNMYDSDNTGRDVSIPVEENYQKYVLQIFEKITRMYGIKKSAPNIAYFHPHDTIIAQYSDCCIYINFMDYDNVEDAQTTISHELIHYLADNNKLTGFYYALDDTYLLGHAFNEGVTNYFSNRYVSNNSCYIFETHVASLIAICYGEKKLENDFFSANVAELRNDFNDSVKKYYRNEKFDSSTFTPFDIMTSMLDEYALSSNNLIRIKQILAIEEMLLYYATEKGFETEVKQEILDFAKFDLFQLVT